MGAPKNHPIFCMKWPPWEEQTSKTTTAAATASSGNLCEFDTPWLFKPFQNLAANLPALPDPFSGLKSRSPRAVVGNEAGVVGKLTSKREWLSEEEQGEAEQRALAAALASGKAATVVEFYSPKCKLCRSLLHEVMQVENRNSDWLSIVMADAENKRWLPELLQYDIRYVPCFVLLDKYGAALAKTGVPHSRLHVIAGLSYLLQMKMPSRKQLIRHQLDQRRECNVARRKSTTA